MGKLILLALCLIVVCVSVAGPASATYDKRIDIVTFCCPCTTDKHLCQPQFDALNWQSVNGHILAMGSDAHYDEIHANGNFLAVYYNSLNDNWSTMTATQKADQIQSWCNTQFPSVMPTWLVLNEISAGTWPGNATYRQWVIDVVSRLKNTYGHRVVICSPFATPGANDSSWQSLADVSEAIGIECYLTGQDINASGNSVSWCQTQYQNSKNAYIARGVSSAKLFLVENFANTVTNTAWGRSGVSYAGWDNAIRTRSQAAHNVGFTGFVSYAWSGNDMLVSDTDLIHFEQTYASQPLP